MNCKENKTVDFIADTGASDTFTNDLTNFTTLKELNGSVGSLLQKGYFLNGEKKKMTKKT